MIWLVQLNYANESMLRSSTNGIKMSGFNSNLREQSWNSKCQILFTGSHTSGGG